MKPVFAAHFHKACSLGTTDKIHYKPDDIAILTANLAAEMKEKGFAVIYDGNDIFKNYKPSTPKGTILFVHLSGGIGDIIAFSAVTKYLKDYTIIAFTDPDFFCLWQQFSSQNIICKHSLSKIVTGLDKVHSLHRLPIEYAVVLAGGKNWYRAYFERLGVDPCTNYFRPEMISEEKEIKTMIFISHRASCQMRSSRFQDFYLPAKKVFKNRQFYVNEGDLTPADREFICQKTVDVHIFKTGTVEQYLKNLAMAELVISTDTGAIHYREAIRKPALAAFGTMTVESRTSCYQYTRSFDVKSTCPLQPCFTHELIKGANCEAVDGQPGVTTAPCIVGKEFQEQLEYELSNYKY